MAGLHVAAAADDRDEFALARGRNRQFSHRLPLPKPIDAGPRHANQRSQTDTYRERPKPSSDSTHLPPPAKEGSITMAADRSGISRGSVLSILNTAVNVLIGLPRAAAAMGLADSK